MTISERALKKIRPPAEQPLVPASFPIGRAWFVVCVMGRQESDVSRETRDLGFPTFCPMERKTRIIRGRRVERSNPVFGGYLFVQFDRERDNWGIINAIDGVLGILQNGNIPSRVPDILIEKLQEAVAAGVFDAAHTLKEGDRVEITKGPLAGFMARVKNARAKDRTKVLLDTLGMITVDPCYLRKLD